MATRANRLSHEHVRALNMIDFVFYDLPWSRWTKAAQLDKEVIDAWRVYFDSLSPEKNYDFDQRTAAFVDLLYAMSRALGFDFDKVQLKNGAYWPQAHGDLDKEQDMLRKGLIEIVDGTRPLLVAPCENRSPAQRRPSQEVAASPQSNSLSDKAVAEAA